MGKTATCIEWGVCMWPLHLVIETMWGKQKNKNKNTAIKYDVECLYC